METPYDHEEIERRWQRRWDDSDLNRVDLDAPTRRGEKLYNLVEFPYPSAEGLHVGHALTYCGADAFGRFERMRGRRVFQPMGFDAFGIHTENYALKVGRHPDRLTAETVANYRRQLRRLGAAWDWSREVVTSDPRYYRWTQWIFLQLHRAGLAERREAPVVWCPSCLTVLAREQLEGAACERCGTTVTERVMRQWFLRITAYADRLLDGLDDLDWPEAAKNRQRAWIGRSDDGGTYRLHDWLISRQRYWGPPIPIVYCERCGIVPVPEDDLPVLLPDVADVRPSGTGRSPLAAVESFVNTSCPACRGPAERETDVSDTFLDSAWFFLRYPSTDVDDRPWDPDRTARWLPVDHYAGGPEHVARHHLYARFVTMALHDLGLVPLAEPFPRIRLHGMLSLRGAKMSKSRGNVVNPDELVSEHGADVTRLFLLFGRPWEADGAYSPDGIAGMTRFLGRVWRAAVESPERALGTSEIDDAVDLAVRRVTEAYASMRFNLAIAALMGLVSAIEHDGADERARRTLVLLLAPLAPHVAEELWCRLGGAFPIQAQGWPAPPAAPVPDEIELVVQVDGKVRDRVRVPPGLDERGALERALSSERVRRHLGGRRPARVVHVPDRLINLLP